MDVSQSHRMLAASQGAGVEGRLETIAGGDQFIHETHLPLIEDWALESLSAPLFQGLWVGLEASTGRPR